MIAGASTTLVTGGFVVLPLLVAAGFVLACDAADRRLGERTDVRRRRAVSIGAAVLAWLLLTALTRAVCCAASTRSRLPSRAWCSR